MSILGFIIGLAFLTWAVMPFFKKDSTWISLHMEGDELEDRKQRVYGNIADLEFDHAMGRLSEIDFTMIRNSFLKEAGKVLEQIEQQKSSALLDRIQYDLQHLHTKHGKAKAGKTTARKSSTCSACGRENLPEARFCMNCGKELK